MQLPRVLRDLIIDYYWSYRMFIQRQCLHRELRHLYNLHEIKEFFVVLHNMYNVQAVGE